MTHKAIPIQRGCGSREAGGVYAEFGIGPGGSPLESFMLCPPQPIDVKGMGIKPIGVKLIEVDGVYHVFDWVGSRNYPNVADFLEEARRFGVSRRMAKTLDFSKLTEKSRLILLHSRAYIENFIDYVWPKGQPGRPSIWQGDPLYDRCPKGQGKASDGENHNIPADPPVMCAGIFWQDVEGGEDGGLTSESRLIMRFMPSFSYMAATRPEGVRPRYVVAAFASFPLSRLVVINDREGGSHKEAQAKASKAALPVELEDQ